MQNRRALLVISLTLAAGSPAMAEGPKVSTANDVVYAKPGGGELKLDLARPAEGDGPFPAIVVIHGGGWRAGNKADNRPILAELAKRGYVAISPQYRFCPKDTFPAQVLDVKASVRWLKAHAEEYKVDGKHVGAMGFSAGGHLALMLGLTGKDDGLEGDAPADAPDTQVLAVVNYFGPTDLAADDIPEVTRPLVSDFLGGPAAEQAEAARKASPLSYVSKGDAAILTFQGTKDPLVPYSQAVKLNDAQTAAGVPGRVELLIGANHGWSGDDMIHTMGETVAFFDRYLKPARP